MLGNVVVWEWCRRGTCWFWWGCLLPGLVGVGNGPESEGLEEQQPPEVTRVCQQGRAERGGAGVTGGVWAGWAHTCVLNVGSVYVSTSLRCTASPTWLQRWNVTLETLLSCCPSYSL